MENTMIQTNDSALILAQLDALLEDENDWVAALANTSAFLNQILEKINWVGFYLFNGTELVLGPFQGKVACSRIAMHKGVCGTAAGLRKSQRIDDVHQFPGHIACDGASNSELVCPILWEDTLLGVLDLDSPQFHRFSDQDQQLMENIAQRLSLFYATKIK